MLTGINPAIGLVFASAMTVITDIFAPYTKLMHFLLLLMVVDYFTGCFIAIFLKKSPKSKKGNYDSAAGFAGLFRKGGILLVLLVCTQLDSVLGTQYVTSMAIWFFALNELYSLKENLVIMGVKIPPSLNDAIDIIRKKTDDRTKPPD